MDSLSGLLSGVSVTRDVRVEKQRTVVDSLPINERTRMWLKVVLINRNDIRILFGITFANQWGHFTDQWMSPIIHSYLDWIDYPKGNHILTKQDDSLHSVVISDDGYCVYIASGDQTITVLNLANHEDNGDDSDERDNLLTPISQWIAHSKSVNSLCFHPLIGLISGSEDRTLRIWRLFNYDLIATLKGHTDTIEHVNVNENGSMIASGSNDNSVRLWCSKTRLCLRILNGHIHDVYSVIFCRRSDEMNQSINDSNILITASLDGCIKSWNTDTGQELRNTSFGRSRYICHLSINCDSSMIVCVVFSGLIVMSWPDMTVIKEIPNISPSVCTFHPTLPDVLVSDDENREKYLVCLMNARMGKLIRVLGHHNSYLYDFCFTPDGSRLISVSGDRTARMWDVSGLLLASKLK